MLLEVVMHALPAQVLMVVMVTRWTIGMMVAEEALAGRAVSCVVIVASLVVV